MADGKIMGSSFGIVGRASSSDPSNVRVPCVAMRRAPLVLLLIAACVVPLAANTIRTRPSSDALDPYDDCIRRAATARAGGGSATTAKLDEDRRVCADEASR